MPSLVTDELLDAIALAESNNNPQAVGDAGLAVGAYQMQPIAYQDVQEFFPKRFGQIAYESLRTNPQLQRQAAKAYLQVGEQKYGIKDLDRLISFYNAGLRARQGTLINPDYINHVKGSMKPQSKADPIEEGVRRIFRMTMQAGFQPLSTQEIEGILAKVEPVRALPGVQKAEIPPDERERRAVSAINKSLQGRSRTTGTVPEGVV